MITREFQLHIDASLLNFQFTEAMYVTVKYNTWFEGNTVYCLVYDIAIGPTILLELNNRPELVRQADSAAMCDAKVYWSNRHAKENVVKELPVSNNDKNSGQLYSAFDRALAPFIKH